MIDRNAYRFELRDEVASLPIYEIDLVAPADEFPCRLQDASFDSPIGLCPVEVGEDVHAGPVDVILRRLMEGQRELRLSTQGRSNTMMNPAAHWRRTMCHADRAICNEMAGTDFCSPVDASRW